MTIAFLLAALAIATPGDGLAVRPTVEHPVAVLRGLDKITARVMRLEVEVGGTATFGTLTITVQACRGTTPEERPENAAFLEIVDEPPGEPAESVFSGWMFSSSPAISALDHAVYDVWVVECAEALSPVDEEGRPVERQPLPEAPPLPPPLPEPRRPG
ncbi:MAG: DUF2155 domain-containing protein [Alphaproteobacteria bacterium]|nr:DUF2155 domain-containing protein [Alphaproteobacteria bacterium]